MSAKLPARVRLTPILLAAAVWAVGLGLCGMAQAQTAQQYWQCRAPSSGVEAGWCPASSANPIPVSPSAPSGTQDVNVKQVAGTAVSALGANVPAGTLPVQQADGVAISPATLTATGVLLGPIDANGFAAISWQITSFGVGTIIVESSNDNTNWWPALVVPTGFPPAVIDYNIYDSLDMFQSPVSARYYRLRVSAYTSGTFTARGLLKKDFSNIVTSSQTNFGYVLGNLVSTGAGATGTGSLRVGVAQDTTTIAGAAPGTAVSPSTNVLSTVQVPSAASAAGIVSVQSAAVETGHVIKASAGNLYDFNVSADATLSGAGWAVMIFNSTTVPAAGAVTPTKCYLAASGTTSISAAFPTPLYLGTGTSMAVSSGQTCFTKTDSAHGFISADVQ